MKDNKVINIIKNALHRRYVPVTVYILLIVSATVNVSLRGGTISYVLFYGVLLYLPLSLFYMLYILWALKIYQGVDAKLIEKNTTEKYHLVIENAGILPICEIRFFYDESITVFPEDFTKNPFKLLPYGKTELETEMLCRYAGDYDAGLEGYTVQDTFGIVRIKVKLKVPVRVRVLPAVSGVNEDAVLRILSEEKNGKLFDLESPENILGNDLRKYTEGDKKSSVNWKRYAVTREMYVRLPEKQHSEMVTLVLVTEEPDGSLESIKLRDGYLEYLVAVAQYFGMRHKPLMLCYYEYSVKRFLIDSPDSFHEFYSNCLPVIGGKAAAGHEELLTDGVNADNGNILIFREKDHEFK